MLINKKAVKDFTLDYCKQYRPKFTRVSKDYLMNIDHILQIKIGEYVRSLPSVGKTIK